MANVLILSNFPLRKNNLEDVINLENYKEIVEIIKSIEDVKDVYLTEEENRVVIYIERYPIVRKINLKGNIAVSRDEILSYLGLYEGIPIHGQEFNEVEIEERIKALYMEKGFLDAKVGVVITKDGKGYIDLYIGVDEGPVYFTERGFYKGSSYDPSLLDSKIGLVRGRIFKENLFREGVFSIQDFYIKEGFWDSFVYYEGIEKIRLKKPFYRVLFPRDGELKGKPLRFFGSLAEGLSNLFSHPIGTLKALTGRGYVARPVFQIIEGKRYSIIWEGNKFFSGEELKRITELEERGLDPFSLEEAKEKVLKAYYRKGFFDVKVGYERKGETVIFRIEEGERYKILGDLFKDEYYDRDKIEKFLEAELDKLYKEGYTLAQGSISEEVLKENREVKVYVNIDKGKKQILKSFVYEGENRDIKRIFSRHAEKLPAIFNTNLIEAINLDLQRYFLKKGLMEADFEVDVKIEEDENSLYYTYVYHVKEGQVYKLGKTIYYGYNKTSLRELSYMTEKAENYSEDLNDKTLYSMLNSGIFSGINIETFIDKEKKLVHRLIQLSEDKRGIFDLSLGYNTEEGISLESFIGLKNLFGIGLSSGFGYKRTSKRELYNFTLHDDFLFSRKNWLKFNLFKSHEEHRSY
ncbi:MAG: POTRA domain-containing protein, partial [Caldimicrobium sp.]